MESIVTVNDVWYTVNITVTDSNEINPLSNTYIVTFIVPVSVKEETTTTTLETEQIETFGVNITLYEVEQEDHTEGTRPFFKLLMTSNQGVLDIYFSETMVIPSNLSAIDASVLDVKLISGTSSDAKYHTFTWEAVDFSS